MRRAKFEIQRIQTTCVPSNEQQLTNQFIRSQSMLASHSRKLTLQNCDHVTVVVICFANTHSCGAWLCLLCAACLSPYVKIFFDNTLP